MTTLKLPLRFASGTIFDADGKVVKPADIIDRLHLYDDLVRAAESLLRYKGQAIPPLVLADAEATYRDAEFLSQKT